MSIIKPSPTECRCLGFTDSNTVKSPLALITTPEGCSISTSDFLIPAVNSFTSKVPITLWGYKFNPLTYLYNPFFNSELKSEFKLTNIGKVKFDFILTKLPPPIADVSIVIFMRKLNATDNEYSKSFPPSTNNHYDHMLIIGCKFRSSYIHLVKIQIIMWVLLIKIHGKEEAALYR